MSRTRVAINGFGRVGRNVFRALYTRPELEVVAIADTNDPEPLEYLLRFDTFLGRFPEEVSVKDDTLHVAGQSISFLTGEAAVTPSWRESKVDVLVETRWRERHTRASLSEQIEAGASRIVLCVPPQDPPDLTVVMGINHHDLTADHRIVSNGSGTAHCIAPVLRILERSFGIERAFLSAIHAYTDQQRLADVPAEDARSGRAAAENIIPQATNAAAVLDGILPECRGKLSAHALNVPIHNGSLVDLVCWHPAAVDASDLNEAVRAAAATSEFAHTLYYEDQPIVSSDILGTTYSSIFDSDATMVASGRVSKTISWFDNGWAYALRVGDLIEHMATVASAPGEREETS